eukprot:gene5087-8687_t
MSGMKFGSKEKCHKCGKTVYLMEKVTVEGKATQIFHNYCFRCSSCNKVVTLANYVSLDDQVFCKTHYLAELHARKSKAQNQTPVNKQENEQEQQQQQQQQQHNDDYGDEHDGYGDEEHDGYGDEEQQEDGYGEEQQQEEPQQEEEQQQEQQQEQQNGQPEGNGDGYSDEDYNDDEY